MNTDKLELVPKLLCQIPLYNVYGYISLYRNI